MVAKALYMKKIKDRILDLNLSAKRSAFLRGTGFCGDPKGN